MALATAGVASQPRQRALILTKDKCHIMDERLRFVARLPEREKMAPLCAEFGISRKTGYKFFNRYKDCASTPSGP
jgi:hypothetical protein